MGLLPLLTLLLLGIQDLTVQVQELQSSKPESGIWVDFRSDALNVKINGQDKSVPVASLKTLQFANSASTNNSEIVVLMQDGSRILPSQIESQGQNIKLQLSPDSAVNVAAQYVRTVQFQKLSDVQQTQWKAIQESRVSGDTLVVVRSAEALDKIEGVIADIGIEKIRFEFNQQKIDAPRTKLAGLKFFNRPKENQKIVAVIKDIWGNTWQVHRLVSAQENAGSAGETLDVVLACGAELRLRVSQLSSIDFSIGSMQYVAELSPISMDRSGGFALKVPVDGSDQLLGPQSIRLPQTNGPSLRMSSGVATYRVPSEYQSLMGRVFLSPDGQQFTPCLVQIKLESTTLWEGKLSYLSQRLEFEVKIQADQRLQFVVQPDSKYPVGDVVTWHEPRMQK